jgi:segregation and condensation protein A
MNMDEQAAGDISLSGFRAELEVFHGPLDLLLHLVRQQEVDITEVSLAGITDRYLAAVRTMEMLDVNVAAEFLVVAATLMEIKSRALLPPAEAAEDEEDGDPCAELVRRLLEYKEFKEAAGELDSRARERAGRFGRPQGRIEADAGDKPEPMALLEDLATWDLMTAFARLLEETSLRPTRHIVHSAVPVSAYVEEIMNRLRAQPRPVEFLEFFVEDCTRPRVVGVFLALLELVKRGVIRLAHDASGAHALRIALLGPLLAPEPPSPSG